MRHFEFRACQAWQAVMTGARCTDCSVLTAAGCGVATVRIAVSCACRAALVSARLHVSGATTGASFATLRMQLQGTLDHT